MFDCVLTDESELVFAHLPQAPSSFKHARTYSCKLGGVSHRADRGRREERMCPMIAALRRSASTGRLELLGEGSAHSVWLGLCFHGLSRHRQHGAASDASAKGAAAPAKRGARAVSQRQACQQRGARAPPGIARLTLVPTATRRRLWPQTSSPPMMRCARTCARRRRVVA